MAIQTEIDEESGLLPIQEIDFDTGGIPIRGTEFLAEPPIEPAPQTVSYSNLTSGNITQTGAGTSAIQIISDAMAAIGLSLVLLSGSGSAKIQYTYDDTATINVGNAYWFDWSKGAVSGNTNLWDNAPRAFILVVTSGTWRLCYKCTKF